MRARLPILIALLAALPASGCTAIAVAAAVGTVGYVQYEKNEVYKDFDEEFNVCWTASIDALEALGYEVPADIDRLHEEPTTEAAIGGKHYRVRIERLVGKRTRVRVRIGTFDSKDNRRRADLVVEELTERLD